METPTKDDIIFKMSLNSFWVLKTCGRQLLLIYGSASADSINCGSCRTVEFATEKNLHRSGSTQFKPVLFNGQLQSVKLNTMQLLERLRKLSRN